MHASQPCILPAWHVAYGMQEQGVFQLAGDFQSCELLKANQFILREKNKKKRRRQEIKKKREFAVHLNVAKI